MLINRSCADIFWTKEGKRAGVALKLVEDDEADKNKDGQAAKKDSPGLEVSPSSPSSDSG